MTFRIRKAFLFPLGLLAIEIVALLVSCIVLKEPIAKIAILAFMILPVIVLFIECLFRRTTIGEDQIETRKFLRRKIVKIAEITAVETIQVKKRAFVTLCAGDDFLIISNAYSKFPLMISQLLSYVPAETVSEETSQMAEEPPRKSTDIISCWLAVALMGFILYAQLRMHS
ncbi:hypothetical protein [Desulfuromonas acetoxidans]|uniref:DUF304 domain-containing protein n=1 Tax=Desulfuromonas acetoxidans (strain DSM 684 / 11070) TaxID=281689 RepID=Q1JVG9_DESA6|nr:hypothetical protein [Desulfuromonas acetoxidans]EAT14244.1 conserved hypothetical protein [Desulfuromonas acetoxidans DSM 684]MBF0645814.1 hypothetical protein [Desulfuromonas acetoxidans]NVD24798.1 hypothetical protein [Desulfuromonas acetoxidans]NVE16843.1 hypothetical protein [Desulfuromonas acetoxidans]